ncbi:AMP-binding protein [Variovorax boronicumulans]|uniref:AMP-binding protein n=1 Tax=Variovorax boronicumulans TaxID=436515 RepID=UPI00078593C8|nr:AMP-binding protein [Variovorax boronicumulans]
MPHIHAPINPSAWLQRHVQERPDQRYLTQPLGGGQERHFTWAQASEEARRMAAHLASFGWEPGSRVAIMSKNCAWWFLADFAIMLAGHVSVPIYPSLTGASVRHVLEHSGAKALFLGKLDSDDWGAMRAGIPPGMPVVRFPLRADGELSDQPVADWDTVIARTPPLTGERSRGVDELATIVYTSGTTGVPKGVMHTFGTLGASLGILMDDYGFGPQDRMLSYLPLAHSADRMFSEMVSLASGCSVTFNESVETFVSDLQKTRPTFFIAVPRLWAKFRQAVLTRIPPAQLTAMLADPEKGPAVRRQVLAQLGLAETRYALSGAAPLSQELHQWYLDLGLELLEIYGMTENMGTHASRPGKGRVGYVGQPRPGAEVRRTDDGEILVRFPGNMRGYFNDPQRTAEVMTEDGFLRTGDVGDIDAEGYLKLTGRAKEIFKTSKGKYVAPTPIENALCGDPLVEACCVTGVGFPQPFAVVLLAPGATRSPELARTLDALRQAVNQTLDPHERLDFLVVAAQSWTIENGLMTPTFKLRRNVFETRFGPHFERWASLGESVVWAE